MKALIVVLLVLLVVSSSAFLNSRRKREHDESEGEENMHKIRKHNAVKEALESLRDPSIMREVEMLMNDPDFVRQMEQIKSDPKAIHAVKSAKDLYKDSERAAEVFNGLSKQAVRNTGDLSNAQLGMMELLRAGKDPKVLSDAMEMLKDPAAAKEVR
jgi:hypothetical protein